MSTFEVIAFILGGAIAEYVICAISYSIGLHNGIDYMRNLLHKESEDLE